MQEAATEMSHRDEFDVIIINDDFDNALAQLGQVLYDLGCAAHVEQKD
jgi:guanylate kinase